MKIALAPSLQKFVSEKIKTGNYVDAAEVIRDSLRRWKKHEETPSVDPDWLEQELEEGLDSPDVAMNGEFWNDLRHELHREHKKRSHRR